MHREEKKHRLREKRIEKELTIYENVEFIEKEIVILIFNKSTYMIFMYIDLNKYLNIRDI